MIVTIAPDNAKALNVLTPNHWTYVREHREFILATSAIDWYLIDLVSCSGQTHIYEAETYSAIKEGQKNSENNEMK